MVDTKDGTSTKNRINAKDSGTAVAKVTATISIQKPNVTTNARNLVNLKVKCSPFIFLKIFLK